MKLGLVRKCVSSVAASFCDLCYDLSNDLKRSPDQNERNPTTRPNVPSETFGDKRRRLISTPLFTGYYVSDRPPDGQTHNHSIR